jgi:ribosome-associated protein
MTGSLKTDLILGNGIVVPAEEVRFVTSRSSGPGGQNVNKVETRVTLLFDLEASSALDEDQKRRIGRRLASRVTRAGLLRVTSQRHRTQAANREAAAERFVELLTTALARRKRRRPTATPAAAKRRRLEDKKRRAKLKETRRLPEIG